MSAKRYTIEVSHDSQTAIPFTAESVAAAVAKAHPTMFEPIGPLRVQAAEGTVTVDLDDLLLLLRRVEPLVKTKPGDILFSAWQPTDPVIDAIDRMGDACLVARNSEHLPSLPVCAHPQDCDEVGGVCTWADCGYSR